MQPMRSVVISLAFMAASASWGQQADLPRPPKPSQDIPDLRVVKPVIICGDCDQPFDTGTHDNVLEDLVSNVYVSELRKALYFQDIVHQFESKAHFDNCNFDDAIEYIDNLLTIVDSYSKAAIAARAANDSNEFQVAVKSAFFSLGQALHAIQDFYAHSNYVEMSVANVKKSTDIVIVAPWRKSGKDLITKLIPRGLVSGHVFWGFPKKCPATVPSHADLAKDKSTTTSGALKVAHLQNRSHYQIAVQLAKAASQQFIDDTFRRWPLLKEVNGKHVAFEIIVDRRGL